MSVLGNLALELLRAAGKAVVRKLLPKDDDELGQPPPFSAVEHQRAQEQAATAHKVKPSGPL
jgi:hypothetical protein